MQDITKGKRQGNQKMGTDSESKKPMKTTSPTSFLSQEGSYLVIINYAHPLQPHTGGSSGGVSPPHPQVAGLEKIEHEIKECDCFSKPRVWWACPLQLPKDWEAGTTWSSGSYIEQISPTIPMTQGKFNHIIITLDQGEWGWGWRSSRKAPTVKSCFLGSPLGLFYPNKWCSSLY